MLESVSWKIIFTKSSFAMGERKLIQTQAKRTQFEYNNNNNVYLKSLSYNCVLLKAIIECKTK
jgi:hypothetical protein